MKNLKKVLALVVVFSMMLCSVAFAAFPDVAEDADYANAVNTLAALDIIGGDDQGNFNPDNTITRAEFTKIVCEMQGLKGDANKGATQFSDVAADHWASGYINMATNMGIINGMGDGTFAPSSPVTYEQAIKMIVIALGYEPMAAEKGGYPTGYLVVAQSTGITKGVKAPAQGAPAVRSLIAELVCKALDVPMMEKVSYGAEAKYEIKDGTEGARVTLLTSKFDVVKLGGVVVGTEKLALNDVDLNDNMANGVNGSSKEGYVTIAYDDNFKSTNSNFQIGLANGKPVTRSIIAEIGDTKADEFFGKRVEAYVREVGSSYEVVAIVVADGKNDMITVDFADFDTTSGRFDYANNEVAFYTSETAKRSEKIDVVAGVNVIWNNSNDNAAYDDLADLYAKAARPAKATFVDWNADDVYDLILVDEYKFYVVDKIDADIYTLSTVQGADFVLDPEDEEYEIVINNAKGEAISFDDIAVDDVIAVVSDDIDNPYNFTSFINITVLGKSVVEGKVVSYNLKDGVKTITIDGEKYEAKAGITGYNKIGLGSEGLFYIGLDNKVVAFEGSRAAAGNFAIIIEAGESGGTFNKGYQFKVLTDEGNVVIYNLADEIKIRTDLTTGLKYKAEATTAIAAGDFDNTGFAALDGQTFADFVNDFTAITAAQLEANIASRLVQIKVNSDNEIYEIAPASTVANAADNNFEIDATVDGEFNATTAKVSDANGVVKFDDNTVIFSINKNDIEKSKVVKVDTLIDDANYKIIGVDYENRIHSAAVVLNGGDTLAGSVNGMAVVTAKADTTDANGDEAVALSVVVNGAKEEVEILVTRDTAVDTTYNAENSVATTLAGNMNVGSLLLYTADEAGNALVIAAIANINNAGDGYNFVLKNGVDATYGTGSKAATFVYGVTNDVLDDDLSTTDGSIAIDGNTNKYRFNNAGRNDRIEVGSYKGGNVVTPANGQGNRVLARVVDREVIDIISLDARVNY